MNTEGIGGEQNALVFSTSGFLNTQIFIFVKEFSNFFLGGRSISGKELWIINNLGMLIKEKKNNYSIISKL